jgi:hypothetical protein
LNIKFIQKSDQQRYILGVVYEPDASPDTQGDYSTAPEIEKACHGFMKNLQNQSKVAKQLTEGILKALANGDEITVDVTDIYEDIEKGALGLNHVSWADSIGDIVENYISPVDFEIKDPYGEVQKVKRGSWLMGAVLSPENYKKTQNGELTGFSMGGSGIRIPEGVKKKKTT